MAPLVSFSNSSGTPPMRLVSAMPEISSFEREECDRRPDLEAVTAALHEGEHVPSVVQSAPGGSSETISGEVGIREDRGAAAAPPFTPPARTAPSPDPFRFDSLHDKFGLGLWPEPGEKHPWER